MNFLNTTVEQTLIRWNTDKWKEAGRAFHHALDATCKIRGKYAFRKSAGTQPRTPINRGLFEAELVVFGSLEPSKLIQAIAQKSRVEQLFVKALSENKDLIQSLLYGTGSTESSNARIIALNSIVNEAINA